MYQSHSATQSGLTLCHSMDCSPPGSFVHGISQQEYWSRLPFPPPGDLPYPGIKPMTPMFPTLAGGFFTTEPLGKPHQLYRNIRDQKNVTLHMEENSCLTHSYTPHLRQPVLKVWWYQNSETQLWLSYSNWCNSAVTRERVLWTLSCYYSE